MSLQLMFICMHRVYQCMVGQKILTPLPGFLATTGGFTRIRENGAGVKWFCIYNKEGGGLGIVKFLGLIPLSTLART